MPTSSSLIRASGLAAMSGGALGVVLTPILVYHWTTYSDAYLAYGKAYFLVYLGCLAGLVGFNAQRKGSPGRSRTEKRGISLLFAGLTLSLVGDIFAYWGDGLGGEPIGGGEFTALQAGGFAVEMWGLLILLVGSVALGVAYLRANVLPRWLAWLLILAGPGGILLSALHAPSGTLLVFCFAWAVLGHSLLRGKGPTGRQTGARSVRRKGSIMGSPGITRWGGMALMLGALMFMLTKTRGYVDPDDSLLGYFMLAGFSLWLLGLAALYARYAPLSGGLGKTGLGMSIVGIVLLAVGHPFSFMTRFDLFVLVILGTLALTLGPLLFGLAAWRTLLFGTAAAQGEVLPRRWRAVPLFTGLMGVAWFFNTGETTFFVFRTLFAFGWLLMGYVLFSDEREAAEKLAPQEI